MKIKIFFTLLFFCANTNAQILIIDKTDTAAYERKTATKGNISIGLEGDKQQKLLLDGTNTLDFQLQHYKELLILATSYRFTYNDGEDFLNAGYIHLRWRHGYKDKWHPETFVQYQWDKARGLVHRFITGENIRYNYWHKNKWQLSAATGVMYENEVWNYVAVDTLLKPAIEINQITHLLKSNNYIKWEGKLSATSNLTAVIFLQTPFKNFLQNYRIAPSIKLDIAISKHFNFGFAIAGVYDNNPVVPIKNFYYNFSNGVAYVF